MPIQRLCLVLSLAVTAVLAGCGQQSRHEPEEMYFLVTANKRIPYWQQARAGFEAAGRQIGVRNEFAGPDTYNPEEQRSELQRITRLDPKPSGILISVTDAALLAPEIDAAIAAGIPVITIDSDAPQSKRLFFIGTNNFQAGLMGGQLLVKELKGKGNVVLYTIDGQPNLQERLHGYEAALRGSPGIRIAQTIDIKGDPRVAFDRTEQLMAKQKDFQAFVCLEALSCKEVAEVLDRSRVTGKVVIAMDTDDGTLKWLRQGSINATIAQKPYTMAYYGLTMLDDLRHNRPQSLDHDWERDPHAPVPAIVDTGVILVTKENVEAIAKAQQLGNQQ